jgi:hypothetical protein
VNGWVVIVALCVLVALPGPVRAAKPLLDVAAEPVDKPWWRRAQWHPRAAAVHGVAIKRLHPQWCAAEALRRAPLDEAFGAAEVDRALAGRTFMLEGAFDGSGALQRAFVGAYRRCDGEQGLFVAVVEPARDRTRMRFLVEVPDPGSALALLDREPDGTLAVWWCADCGNGSRIAYNRERREFYVAGPATRR